MDTQRTHLVAQLFLRMCFAWWKPLEDIQKYLPWNMTERQKQLFSEPPKHEDLN